MGAGQFLRDFRRDYHLQKSLAHRKSVLVRKEKLCKKQMKVHLAVISHDRSPGKKNKNKNTFNMSICSCVTQLPEAPRQISNWGP